MEPAMAYKMLQIILDHDERVFTLIIIKTGWKPNTEVVSFFYLIEMSFNIQINTCIYFFQHSHKFSHFSLEYLRKEFKSMSHVLYHIALLRKSETFLWWHVNEKLPNYFDFTVYFR